MKKEYTQNTHILTPGWGKSGETLVNPYAPKLEDPKIVYNMAHELIVKVHYWVHKKGYTTTVGTGILNKKERKLKYKYLGYTFDQKWPKKMNTGRLIFAFTPKKRKDYMGSIKTK